MQVRQPPIAKHNPKNKTPGKPKIQNQPQIPKHKPKKTHPSQAIQSPDKPKHSIITNDRKRTHPKISPPRPPPKRRAVVDTAPRRKSNRLISLEDNIIDLE